MIAKYMWSCDQNQNQNIENSDDESNNSDEQFEDKENKIKYLVIDTPGIGDTKLKDHQVLDIIAEAVYLVRDGLSQVFFVIDGRFDQYEMATYNLLRTIIFDENITNHTTITRTRFTNFTKPKKCKADTDLMIKEARDKRIELETKIADNKNKIESLLSDDKEYKKIAAEIEKAKKELIATNNRKSVV